MFVLWYAPDMPPSGSHPAPIWVPSGSRLGPILFKLRHADDHAEHVTLNKLRIGPTVFFAIQHHFAHPGTKFVRPVNFPKEGRQNRIFREGHKMGRVDQAKAVRAVSVVCGHFAAFDNQTGRHAAGIFAVDEDVGRHLAENGVPQTAALYASQVKRSGRCFWMKARMRS